MGFDSLHFRFFRDKIMTNDEKNEILAAIDEANDSVMSTIACGQILDAPEDFNRVIEDAISKLRYTVSSMAIEIEDEEFEK